ncbi:O-antigen ligase family protein [Balneola vulgaris]|uniref:O-antigen ligase family protein n=1 Tax=Balneola vulgaris TaxID=287535 RepID=UPI0003659BE2|nr:O-antigen ligase family protein [Balneola vulgaris]
MLAIQPHIQRSNLVTAAILISGLLGVSLIYFGVISWLIILAISTAIMVFGLSASKKQMFVLAYLLSCILFLENSAGIEPIEIPFLVLSSLLAAFVAFKFITGNLPLHTFQDTLFLVLHLLLPFAIILGMINGANTYTAVGEITFYSGVLIYFPLRELLNKASFQKLMAGLLLLTIGFVLIRNFIDYRQIIIQAFMPWQAENARVALNELIIMIGVLLFFTSTISYSKLSMKALSFLAFCISLMGLILTQSRGYWIATLFGLGIIFLLVNKSQKRQILLIGGTSLITGVLLLNLFFSDLLEIVVNSLIERFSSITSTQLDISLRERVLETKKVWELISANPIVGYGFGVTYPRRFLMEGFTTSYSYVHNGYLAVWYKLGLLGLLFFISTWALTIRNYVQGLKAKAIQTTNAIIPITFIAALCGMVLVNITSPQTLSFDGVLITTIAAAYSITFKNTQKPS